MQTVELLLIVVSVGAIIFRAFLLKRTSNFYLLSGLTLFLILELGFGGYRWQMIPAYLLWSISMLIIWLHSDRRPKLILKILIGFGIFLVLVPTILFPIALPIFELPTPTGSYHVGTKDIYLETNREEIIKADPSDHRDFMVKAWFPSDKKGQTQDPYVDHGGRSGFAMKYGLPPSTMDYLDYVNTHVYRDVEIADQKFPVLVFSHGYNSRANGYYALISEIVSHGYIVLGINHTYESTGSTYPDGKEVYFDNEYAQKIQENTWQIIEPVIKIFKETDSFEERHPIARKALIDYFVRDMVERWAQDITDVVDQLDDWNLKYFDNHMDLTRIGVFGHSRGGGAAGEAALIDPRIKVGVNVDGVQWGRAVDTLYQKPFMSLSSDWPPEHENLNPHAYIGKSSHEFYDAVVLHSAHSNFMDIPFMIPFRALSQAGSIDPELAMKINTEVLLAFFDKHLKNKEVDPTTLGERYDNLQMKLYEGGSIR